MCHFCMKWISNFLFQIAVFCDPQCVHGTCTGPGQCTCEVGWTSHACDIGEWTLLGLVSIGKRINGIIIYSVVQHSCVVRLIRSALNMLNNIERACSWLDVLYASQFHSSLCIYIVWVTLFSFTAVKALYSVKSDS